MRQPLYVSAFTPDYAEEAAALVKTLDQFGLPHCVRMYSPRGSWTKNGHIKPEVIRDALDWHHGPVVWVDADARIVAPPTLFDTMDCDFAAHWFKGEQLAAGTLYVNDTVVARWLLDKWQGICAQLSDETDQKHLECLVHINTVNGILKVDRLPPAYCFIFDLSRELHPDVEPVILHTQASRRLRHD